MKIDLSTLKERVAERYDPEYLVDVLGLSSEDILDAFEDKLLERRSEFSEVEDDN